MLNVTVRSNLCPRSTVQGSRCGLHMCRHRERIRKRHPRLPDAVARQARRFLVSGVGSNCETQCQSGGVPMRKMMPLREDRDRQVRVADSDAEEHTGRIAQNEQLGERPS